VDVVFSSRVGESLSLSQPALPPEKSLTSHTYTSHSFPFLSNVQPKSSEIEFPRKSLKICMSTGLAAFTLQHRACNFKVDNKNGNPFARCLFDSKWRCPCNLKSQRISFTIFFTRGYLMTLYQIQLWLHRECGLNLQCLREDKV